MYLQIPVKRLGKQNNDDDYDDDDDSDDDDDGHDEKRMIEYGFYDAIIIK